MNGTVFSVALLAACAAGAATLDVPRLPAPAFADREASGDSALPEGLTNGAFRVFRLELAFDATPSNSVQVAFGRDAPPADGFLAAEETDLIVGWDCGEWFLRPRGLANRFAAAASPAPGRRALTASVRVDARGVPRSAEFRDGGTAFAFPGLALPPVPDWLDPGPWTRMRVTARGAGAPEEAVRAVFAPDGAQVILR